MKPTRKAALGVLAGVAVLAAVAPSPDDHDAPKAKPQAHAAEKPTTTVKPAPGVEVHEESSEPESDTRRIASEVAQEFREGFGRQSGYVPVWARFPYGDGTPLRIRFADDLDGWDNSLEVRTDLPTNTEGQAREIAGAVLGIGFPKGLCKVDVMSAIGTRLVEHESQMPGC